MMQDHRYTIHRHQYIYRDGEQYGYVHDPIRCLTVTPDALYIECHPDPTDPPSQTYCCMNMDRATVRWNVFEGITQQTCQQLHDTETTIHYAGDPPVWPLMIDERRVMYHDRLLFDGAAPVKEVLHFEGRFYVLTEEYAEGANVYCTAENGTLCWRIEQRESEQYWYMNRPQEPARYTGLSWRKGAPWAFMFAGFDCRLDPETGKIVEMVWTR